MTGPFLYKVTYYDDFEEGNKTEGGVLFDESYAGAAQKIDNFYGNDLVSIDYLIALEEGSLLNFGEDILEAIKNSVGV